MQLQLAEFKQKAGAADVNKLYEIYRSFDNCGVESERLSYRVAVFLDDFILSKNIEKAWGETGMRLVAPLLTG
jgi:hypothetical protein